MEWLFWNPVHNKGKTTDQKHSEALEVSAFEIIYKLNALFAV
jgi:hypothetical protein